MRAGRSSALETLEGFARMSDRQQRMLRTSLAVGKKNVSDANCHLAVFYLENEVQQPGGRTRQSDLRRFQHSGYETEGNLTLAGLRAQIEKTGFPCIVAPSERPSTDGALMPLHTFVALGHRGADIEIWEKQGFASAPHRTTLTEVYARYASHSRDLYWSTRLMAAIKNSRDRRP